MISAEALIQLYQLQPHPEGGYFKETYRAMGQIPQQALPQVFQGDRSYCTGIYFLLPQGTKSHLHRLHSDEMWHFYLGEPMTLVQMHEEFGVEQIILGSDIQAGHKLQHVVPAGWWFGGYPCSGSAYSFVGCTVAPGFDFAEFELARRSQLLQQFPDAATLICQLTPED